MRPILMTATDLLIAMIMNDYEWVRLNYQIGWWNYVYIVEKNELYNDKWPFEIEMN